MGTYPPMDVTKLTKKERMEALSSLMFTTEKSDGWVETVNVLLVANNKKMMDMTRLLGALPLYLLMD